MNSIRLISILVLGILVNIPLLSANDNKLTEELESICSEYKATIGVAVIANSKDTTVINNEVHYPMLSVFKFHQALATAKFMEEQGLKFTDSVFVPKQMLSEDTYSPMRDKHVEGDFNISIGNLLIYILQQSDNIACDVLFDLTGGPKATDKYIRSLGINDFAINHNEKEMHENIDLCRENWSKPLATAKLLDIFISGNILSKDCRYFIFKTMTNCTTGENRLTKPIKGSDAIIGHKTGTSDKDNQGRFIGINDVGFVLLPDNKYYVIAVFIKDSAESYTDNEAIIARISQAVYSYCSR